MKKIIVNKSNGKIVSFGFEDTSRFDLNEFDIIGVSITELPDEIQFCKYNYLNDKVVIDEVYKQQILQQEIEKKQKTNLARQYIENNNPADVVSIPALRERVKRLEVLLGTYKWL